MNQNLKVIQIPENKFHHFFLSCGWEKENMELSSYLILSFRQ